jgi:AcrR family transcriptional regulator
MSNPDKEIQILKAAKDCFARFGYEKTTLDDIGKMAQLNKASLYYYYKNKEAIFVAVILKESEESLKLLQAQVHDAPGCREQILTFQRERIRQMKTMVNLNNLSKDTIISEAPKFAELAQKVCEMEANYLDQVIRKCVESGEFKPCDTRRIAETILTIANALKHKAMQGPTFQFAEADYRKIEEETVFAISLILDGISSR